ncbi:hypothetical protein E8E11_007368 [Didymella keratinophila]|nr:hypothetical protein E8E11_007368 [Didymella keratinophila]
MKSAIAFSAMLAGAEAAETVLGAYIFHRHGDRTPKALAPTSLTPLGYDEVYRSGQYYNSRYITGDNRIKGINEETVKLSQLSVTSPVDNVLQNSAMGFLQGLYPPVQTVQTLGNGTDVTAPLSGYQLIPVNTIATGAGSEDAGWLQDASSCANAKTSSNNYFNSAEYQNTLKSTTDFYNSLVPVVNQTLTADQVSFKNAYVVYDLINVAEIHNSSIPSSEVLTNETLKELLVLANQHEYGLAYNASDDMRAIAGMQLAGEILSYMNSTITSGGAKKLGIQFGAYATALSLFGLMDLPKVSDDFTGVIDYASSLVFELVTNASTDAFPAAEDLSVRFLFHNGTASNASEPIAYPLFGGESELVSWNDFSSNLNKFGVSNSEQWCTKCGNSTGTCAAYAGSSGSGSASTQQKSSGGISPAIGGVIGAMVTLAVILGSLAAFMLLGGFRLVSKKHLAGTGAAAAASEEKVGTKA